MVTGGVREMRIFSMSRGTCSFWGGGVVAISMMYMAALRRTEGEVFGIDQEVVKGLVGEVDHVFGFLAEEDGAVVLSVGERFAKWQGVATPMGNGVAVDAGLGRGIS